MYISILLIEKNSIYFLFKNCEKVIKIQNETAPLRKKVDDINNQLDNVFNKYNEDIKSGYKITTDDLKKIYEQ